MIPRGVRNHNPGNIKANSIVWDGQLAYEDRTPAQREEHTFVVFRGPWWGIRAMAKILRNYAEWHDLHTVREIVARWAPSSDRNPTSNYMNFVADQMGVEADDRLHLDDYYTLRSLVRAVILFENGACPYRWEIDAGLILAGIEPTVEYA